MVAFKGGFSRPYIHHKRVVVFVARLAAGHTPTTSGHESIGGSGGLQGPVQPRSHHKRVAFYGWLAGLPHSRHTLPTPMPMPFRFHASRSEKLWTEVTDGVQRLITLTYGVCEEPC